jgi:phosphatidylinositol alpha-1,6-mannosyltransferase
MAARRPLLCTVTQIGDRGGIARVSILLWKTLQERFDGRCEIVTLLPADQSLPGLGDKMRFSLAVAGRQIRNRTEWVLFDHLQLASVQHLVWPSCRRRPYGVFLHSIEAWNPLSPQRKRALREATVRIANSHYTAKRIASAHPGIGPIEVCHLALPAGAGAANSEAPDQALLERMGRNVVLVVGRMVHAEGYKGQDLLIEAWPMVTGCVPDAQLVIVGRGDDVPRLQQMAKGEARILFTGPVSEATLHALYERAALFAMPSRLEGFGLVYLEAMLHRLPCIGSTEDAAGEVIVDGETGYLIDRQDIPALAGAIVRCLKDPGLRKRLGEAGHARLNTRFTPENFRDRLFTAMTSLTEM